MALFDTVVDPLVSGIFGDSKDERAAAQAALDRALAQYTGIEIPREETINLQQQIATPTYTPTAQIPSAVLQAYPELTYGQVDPALYEALTQQDTGLSRLEYNPEYEAAQQETLNALQEIARGGGLSAQDKADLAAIESQINAADRGRREAVLQGMRTRGMQGGGLELLAQLQGAQDASSTQSQRDLDVAAMAKARELDAILQSGQFASQLGQAQYGRESEAAKAQDIINQFNISNQNRAGQANQDAINRMALANTQNQYRADLANRQAEMERQRFNIANANQIRAANIAALNQAGMFNVQNQQAVNAANTGIANQEALYNAALPQQQFQNQMSRAAGISGQYGVQAQKSLADAAARDRQIAGYIDMAIKGATAATNGGASGGQGATTTGGSTQPTNSFALNKPEDEEDFFSI